MIFLSKNLKFLREKRGMKQGELAKMLDIKANSISNYENSVSAPDYNILEKIITLFNVSAHDILYADIEFSSESKKSRNLISEETTSDFINKICELSAENALLKKENEDLKNIHKKRSRDASISIAAEPKIDYIQKEK